MLGKGFYSISIVSAFSCGWAKTTANTLRVDSYFFGNGGKHVCFQKNPDTCGRGLIMQKKKSSITGCMCLI